MKKIQSILLAAIAATMVLTACSSDDYSYSPGEKSAGAFLTAAKSSFVYTPGQKQVLTLGLGRTEFAGAETVTLSGNHPAFKVPASVSFAAGEKAKDVEIPFALETGESAKLTVKVTSATSAYGADSVVVNVTCDYEWVSLGVGTYQDAFFFENGPYEVEILQCTGVPNMYRIVGPYVTAIEEGEWDYDPSCPPTENVDILVVNSGETYAGQVVGFDGLIGYDVIHSGYFNSSYGAEIKIYHPSEGFKDHDTPDTWAYNRVLAWQDVESNGVLVPGQVQLAPYYYMDGVGGWNYADQDGSIIITFPGYNPKDYSIELDYAGIFTSVANEVFAFAYVTAGADAENIVGTVVDASFDEAEVAQALATGEIISSSVEDGHIYAPIPDGMTGKMKLVVAVVEDNELKAYDSAIFEYYGGGANPWVSLGNGLMTDNLVVTMYSPDGVSVFEPLTYEVEIEENTDHPGLYRVVDAFQATAEFLEVAYTSTALEVNAIDPEGVYIEPQSTGVDDGDGEIFVCSWGGYALLSSDFDAVKAEGDLGTLKDGVITLPVIPTPQGSTFQGIFFQGSSAYYCGSEGEFQLVLPNTNAAAAMKAPAISAKARSFEKRLNAYNKVDKVALKKMMRTLKLKKIQKALKK